MNDQTSPVNRRSALLQLAGIGSGLSIISIVGCSKLLLGSGKLLFGDPKTTAEFTTLTKEDLTRGLKTVLVVCSAPEASEEDVSTLRLDVVDGVTRRLKLNGVKVVNPDRVADWRYERDGIFNDPRELAQDFETDYIIWIDIQGFGLREPNSLKLLRGNTMGFIRVYRVEEVQKKRTALRVYQNEFSLTYPQHQPISETGRGVDVFRRDYIKQLCDVLSERFYDHRPGTRF